MKGLECEIFFFWLITSHQPCRGFNEPRGWIKGSWLEAELVQDKRRSQGQSRSPQYGFGLVWSPGNPLSAWTLLSELFEVTLAAEVKGTLGTNLAPFSIFHVKHNVVWRVVNKSLCSLFVGEFF